MIFNVIEQLQQRAIEHPMVSMSSYGDINLFENKQNIRYPFVNYDVVSSTVYERGIISYKIRVYVCDKNKTPYIAYNKAEIIANDLIRSLDENPSYTLNYFTLNFKDRVDGIWCDFVVEQPVIANCSYDSLFDKALLEDSGYQLTETGDLIIL